MLFSLLKHYLDLYISDTALKVFRSLYCLLYVMVLKLFPRLWGMGISLVLFFYVGSVWPKKEVYIFWEKS